MEVNVFVHKKIISIRTKLKFANYVIFLVKLVLMNQVVKLALKLHLIEQVNQVLFVDALNTIFNLQVT